jgi:hypothetical protein
MSNPEATITARRAADPFVGWLLCAGGLALTLAAFWPGYMSFDSAYQWWQARHGEYSNIHPPAMTLLWALTDRIWPGPGLLFALFALGYWTTHGLLSQASRWSSARRSVILLVAGAWPPLLALLAHVWKDVAVMVLFGIAVAIMALLRQRRHRGAELLCALALLAACAMRHNAITALPPLLFCLLWPMLQGRGWQRVLKATVFTLLGTLLFAALARLPERLPNVVRHDAWPAVAAWDVAAVSVREQRLLVPADLLFPGDPMPRLVAHYTPATNVPTLVGGGVRSNFLFPYTETQTRALRDLWLSLPFRHTRAYFAHRAAVAARLFGWHKDDETRALTLMPGEVAYRDNPPLAARVDAFNQGVQSWLGRLVDTPLFSGWIYLAIAPLLFVVALRRRDARGALAAATVASGVLYALPLLVIAGSAEFRYLSWLVMATVLAGMLLAEPRQWGAGDAR